MSYLVLYLFTIYAFFSSDFAGQKSELPNYADHCPELEDKSTMLKTIWNVLTHPKCAGTVVKKCGAVLSLCCYIPAMCVCLYRIDRLDAVMETIETIWQLQDIQKAVRAFDRSMEEVEEQVVLLKAINERVLTRINIVLKFTKHSQSSDANIGLKTLDKLVTCLRGAEVDLKPVAVWLLLPLKEQNAVSQAVKGNLDALANSNFGLTRHSTAPGAGPNQHRIPIHTVGDEVELGTFEEGLESIDTGTFAAQSMPAGTFAGAGPPLKRTVDGEVPDAPSGTFGTLSEGTKSFPTGTFNS